MSRRRIVAGNWKMNLGPQEAKNLFLKIQEVQTPIEVFVFPSACYVSEFANAGTVSVGAQNGYPKDAGAFTGEVSMKQWAEIGVKAILIGHSERRMYFGETNAFLKEKVDYALELGLTPFFCCGEPIEVRQADKHLEYVQNQLQESLFHLSSEQILKTVIAYEPIWAIGTGLTATVDQAEELHAAIRSWLTQVYGSDVAEQISILYGGSCNPSNAEALFACSNVDGGLIGGAALKIDDFVVLIDPKTWNI